MLPTFYTRCISRISARISEKPAVCYMGGPFSKPISITRFPLFRISFFRFPHPACSSRPPRSRRPQIIAAFQESPSESLHLGEQIFASTHEGNRVEAIALRVEACRQRSSEVVRPGSPSAAQPWVGPWTTISSKLMFDLIAKTKRRPSGSAPEKSLTKPDSPLGWT